ncbi:hypothetical protein ACK8GG_03490 [Micromonosporaceae bacterium DT55]|uniref:hypothetical protein n=1 Tax=Melissospora conviva TaxID=3388432 RepID=UPI003C260779
MADAPGANEHDGERRPAALPAGPALDGRARPVPGTGTGTGAGAGAIRPAAPAGLPDETGSTTAVVGWQQPASAAGTSRPEPAGPGSDSARPFWMPGGDGRDDRRPALPRPRRPARVRAARRADRGPAAGLSALVLLSLLCAFFCWVSAEPFWLATGNAVRGSVVLDGCDGSGLSRRCEGVFTAGDGTFSAAVRVSGVAEPAPGATLVALMRHAGADTAYVEAGPVVRHLRWAAGLLMALLCGGAILAVTGAARLPQHRQRWWTIVTGCAAPLLLFAGFLAATF